MSELFEGLPVEAYDENISALAQGSMLWVRVIDDPLIDDVTWAQMTGSEEVLDEAEERREATSEEAAETAAATDDDVVTE